MAKKDTNTSEDVGTTGHEWDGIEEWNNPLPKWWLYVFYATIVWAIGYWIVYPAWPTASSYTKGFFGYSQRGQVTKDVAASQAEKAVYRDKIAASDLEAIKADPELFNFALAGGQAAFGDNCAPCHGRGAQGAFGYPNLRDDAWLWGGSLEAIHQTIQHGIRAEDSATRMSMMPAFGKLGMLNREQVSDTAEYVMSLSGNEDDAEAAARGKEIFATNCAACHGPDGRGNQALGAPNLTDELWLYGGDKDTIVETINYSRAGMMPAWSGRLDPATIKELAIYVHSLGGGQ
ncbi:cytochrome-c oxidase, cbb3-type subunit III [Methyloceanibacter caenitepidi]|uniref:Cbb3-type cytochrome c oxidase subunit n=1 Tax=Methyloceanibacter caenitepidi TaxID=1384459 RepID=A0A0A8K446_9HYPH|nr:cytochrome-c oxidase, cbb3-type subunit III [Methyloceanibacter caenitepidi]BAQ16764.1 cytochrome c oxidase subunit CcoP [Methyloceanibacter caenitepidi]